MKTTRNYPFTRAEAEAAILSAEKRARNISLARTVGRLSYRNDGIRPCDGLCAFSFVESPRTPGAYKEIPYAS